MHAWNCPHWSTWKKCTSLVLCAGWKLKQTMGVNILRQKGSNCNHSHFPGCITVWGKKKKKKRSNNSKNSLSCCHAAILTQLPFSSSSPGLLMQTHRWKSLIRKYVDNNWPCSDFHNRAMNRRDKKQQKTTNLVCLSLVLLALWNQPWLPRTWTWLIWNCRYFSGIFFIFLATFVIF